MASREQQVAPRLGEPPAVFRVGERILSLTCTDRWRWIVSVDSRELPTRYETQAEAWAAGVREALGLAV